MAKQTGTIKLSGKLGDHVHYTRDGEYFTKSAAQGQHQFSPGSIAAQQSFGLGSTMGKFLKLALKPALDAYQYEGIHNRLTEACKQIFREGPVLRQDSLTFTDYNIKKLVGFNLNKYTPLESLVRDNPIQLHYDLNRFVEITIAEHEPANCFYFNDTTYAISIQLLCSIIDLNIPDFQYFMMPEIVITREQKLFQAKAGTIEVGLLEDKLLLFTTQVRYYRHTNMQYHVSNRKLIAAEISTIDYIKDGKRVDYPQSPVKEAVKQAKTNIPITPIQWK